MVRLTTRRGQMSFKARLSPRHPSRHAVRAVPLGRQTARANMLTNTRARSGLPDARVQGLRGAHREPRPSAKQRGRDIMIAIEQPRFHPRNFPVHWGAGTPNRFRSWPVQALLSPPTNVPRLLYFRGGNQQRRNDLRSCWCVTESRCVTSPSARRRATHVPLAVVEDLEPETKLDLMIPAPEGLSGTVDRRYRPG